MERLEQILKLVSEMERVDVNTLADKLGVSRVTVRKDLDKLESKGFLRREHGFAVSNSGDDLNVRLSVNYDIKSKIAAKAAEFVGDDETVLIESGSTCALLAEALAQSKKNVTIITNSCFIADRIRKYDNCKVILLGGEYQKSSQVTVGPLVKEMLKFFHVRFLFVGVDGFEDGFGFTGKDMMRTEVVSRMMAVSDEVVVLTDSSKFLKVGNVSQFKLGDIHKIITDNHIPADKEMKIVESGVEIIKV